MMTPPLPFPLPEKPIGITDLNEHISCRLCRGYLIDATTLVECLHSFCRKCLVQYLEKNKSCPACDTQVHKTKPLLMIRCVEEKRPVVLKPSVPFEPRPSSKSRGSSHSRLDEMKRRNHFYEKHPEAAIGLSSSEEKGEISGERIIYSPDDVINLSIEYLPEVISYSFLPLSQSKPDHEVKASDPLNQRRYLRCQGGMRVHHLKKWLKSKYDLKSHHDVELFYKHDPLCEAYSMMDLAYIYASRRNGPLSLFYKISDLQKPLKKARKEKDVVEKLNEKVERQAKKRRATVPLGSKSSAKQSPVQIQVIGNTADVSNTNASATEGGNGNSNLVTKMLGKSSNKRLAVVIEKLTVHSTQESTNGFKPIGAHPTPPPLPPLSPLPASLPSAPPPTPSPLLAPQSQPQSQPQPRSYQQPQERKLPVKPHSLPPLPVGVDILEKPWPRGEGLQEQPLALIKPTNGLRGSLPANGCFPSKLVSASGARAAQSDKPYP